MAKAKATVVEEPQNPMLGLVPKFVDDGVSIRTAITKCVYLDEGFPVSLEQDICEALGVEHCPYQIVEYKRAVGMSNSQGATERHEFKLYKAGSSMPMESFTQTFGLDFGSIRANTDQKTQVNKEGKEELVRNAKTARAEFNDRTPAQIKLGRLMNEWGPRFQEVVKMSPDAITHMAAKVAALGKVGNSGRPTSGPSQPNQTAPVTNTVGADEMIN